MIEIAIIKIFFLTVISFIVAVAFTPLLTHFLFKYKLGKRIRTQDSAPIMSRLHAKKSGTPTMGGILIWFTVLLLALLINYFWHVTGNQTLGDLNFLTRTETWLPLGALVLSALVGLFDDFLNIHGIGSKGGGLRVRHRLLAYTVIAIAGAYWFYFKLDWDLIRVPFLGDFNIGLWYIPIFMFIIIATAFSVNETDGLDGLAGGALLTSFAAYATIAFMQGRYDLAAFCGAIVGALLAFLWFNINPARFFMGDTGAMSLGVTLGIVAMLTNTILLLPIIGFVFMIESASVILQVTSKKFRGKKIFLSAPIHHHFEAVGWTEPKVVMRFWIISAVMATVGLIIFLFDFTY